VLQVVFCNVAAPVDEIFVQVIACCVLAPVTFNVVAVRAVQVVTRRFVAPVTVRLKRDDNPVTVMLKKDASPETEMFVKAIIDDDNILRMPDIVRFERNVLPTTFKVPLS